MTLKDWLLNYSNGLGTNDETYNVKIGEQISYIQERRPISGLTGSVQHIVYLKAARSVCVFVKYV